MNQVIEYAKHINSSNEILDWLKTTGKKSLNNNKVNTDQLEHIVDYFNSNKAPRRLRKMSIVDAIRKSKEWTQANQKKGRDLVDTDEDVEMIYGFEDGSMIVKLKTSNAFKREGFLMSHCLGGYSLSDAMDIYSYRDDKNHPHATFEVRKDYNEVVQIKGKGNGSIHPKYVEPILVFLEYLGMDIRPSDMKNLGYYHVNEDQYKLLKEYHCIGS